MPALGTPTWGQRTLVWWLRGGSLWLYQATGPKLTLPKPGLEITLAQVWSKAEGRGREWGVVFTFLRTYLSPLGEEAGQSQGLGQMGAGGSVTW